MDERVVVDVWADVASPWCWIGHRRLAAALAEEPPGSVEVRRHAFELEPGLPPEGKGRGHYAEKFGGEDEMAGMFAHTAEQGRSAGIEFRFDRLHGAPNTRLAHRLVKLADTAELGQQALDALYRAHFVDGVDISDAEAAIGVVARCGLNPTALRVALQEGAGEPEVLADEQTAQKLGIAGVPFFLAGASVAVSGAQEPAVFRRLIAAARERVSAA